MINFFKDSLRELKHVVWPTREETRNYFLIVVITLILFWLYLFVVSTVFTEALFALKDFVNGGTTVDSTIDPSTFIDNLEAPTVESVTVETADEANPVSQTEVTE